MSEAAKIIVYGADWCTTTQATLAHLKRSGVDFRYVDIDKDREAAKWVAGQNNGREKKPTLDVNGHVLTEPTNGELDRLLRAEGILA